ncbi:MAG: hypothetical protein D3913_08255 [Candidatus Electrothrix sp. LOE1_4_5]|nr:hypothetical protein [Candidatus Electrothrix gigas]
MKRLRKSSMITSLAIIIFTMVLGAGASQALEKCDSGTITFAGVYPDLQYDTEGNLKPGVSPYMIQFICDSQAVAAMAGKKQFILHEDLGDSGYATVLTAVSLGQKIKIQTEGGGWNALVTRINLVIPE